MKVGVFWTTTQPSVSSEISTRAGLLDLDEEMLEEVDELHGGSGVNVLLIGLNLHGLGDLVCKSSDAPSLHSLYKISHT